MVNMTGTSTIGVQLSNGATKNYVGPQSIMGGKGNVISGNPIGVQIDGGGGGDANGNFVYINYIGLAQDGVTALPNDTGIVIYNGAYNNQVGGLSTFYRNYISGNTYMGISLNGAKSNIIQGNYVGIDKNANPQGNGKNGIYIYNNSTSNIIGGITTGLGNNIAWNGHEGIYFKDASDDNTMRRNSIYCNGSTLMTPSNNTIKGINENGVGDANYPIPVFTGISADSLTVSGTGPGSSIIEIFQIATCNNCASATNKVQGEIYIGSAVSNNAGAWSYTNATKLTGSLTATATSTVNNSSITVANADNTSEFSNCMFLTLPVRLVSFNGWALDNKTIELQWITASEKDNSYFEIERSTDAVNFRSIGRVTGKGNSATINTYTFTDTYPSQVNYYRLNQTDFDGTINYSNIIEISLDEENISVYPNPNNGEFTVSFKSQASSFLYGIQVYNSIGVQVYSTNRTSIGKTLQKQVDLSNFPAGIYFVTVTIGEQQAIHKVIKY